MNKNVKCKKCLNEWHETFIKDIKTKVTPQSERIAFKGGNGWIPIKCTTNKCKGVVIRLELKNKIEDCQLNAVTTQRREYIKR